MGNQHVRAPVRNLRQLPTGKPTKRVMSNPWKVTGELGKGGLSLWVDGPQLTVPVDGARHVAIRSSDAGSHYVRDGVTGLSATVSGSAHTGVSESAQRQWAGVYCGPSRNTR